MNDELAKMDRSLPKPELFARMSALIDKRIHASYRMYPNNYVAHDLLEGRRIFPTITLPRISSASRPI